MNNIVSYLDKIEDKIVSKPASEREIEYAQIALGLKFSEEYIEVLRHYGCLLVKGETFFGIAQNKAYDVVTNTIEEKRFSPEIPRDMYVVSSLGIDGILILQKEDGHIFELDPSREPRLIKESLMDYIIDL